MILKTKNNKLVHPIGIGTWGVSSQKTDEDNDYVGVVAMKGNEEVEIEAIRYSLDNGQNHLDCAELYGGFYTDEVVGRAIAGYTREDLFIADKLWSCSVEAGKVRSTVEAMLKKLGTDYLDMLYIHWPWSDVNWREAIPQIDDLIDEGVVLNFAVSNFTIADMREAAELARHPIVAVQMNYNLLHKNEVGENFKQYCNENKIEIIAYQPIKRGEVFDNPVIKTIAENHSVTASQVAIAWLLQEKVLPIPKAMNKAHIDDNLAAVDLVLSSNDIASLDLI